MGTEKISKTGQSELARIVKNSNNKTKGGIADLVQDRTKDHLTWGQKGRWGGGGTFQY